MFNFGVHYSPDLLHCGMKIVGSCCSTYSFMPLLSVMVAVVAVEFLCHALLWMTFSCSVCVVALCPPPVLLVPSSTMASDL